MKIKDLSAAERPREKLLSRGAGSLSDGELLAILLRSGSREASALDLARRLLDLADGRLSALFNLPQERMLSLPGVGPGKAAGVIAAFELVRRFLQEEFSGIRIPEGHPDGDKLYITLGGRATGTRRGVQPVLASCDFRRFPIVLGGDGTPAIRGRGHGLDGIELPLSISFLDYVHDRCKGELGRGLAPAYRNRIEAFKAVLLERLSDQDNDELVLLRRGVDGSLKEFSVRIRDDRDGKKLEVF